MSQHMFDTSKNNASLWVRKTCAKKEDCKATQGCKSLYNQTQVCRLGDTSFFRLQGIVKATVSKVFEDLKFKISEGLDQN